MENVTNLHFEVSLFSGSNLADLEYYYLDLKWGTSLTHFGALSSLRVQTLNAPKAYIFHV